MSNVEQFFSFSFPEQQDKKRLKKKKKPGSIIPSARLFQFPSAYRTLTPFRR